ncbi:MAG: hypothetical protein ACLUNO_00645 [Oscillospiraceae bacterium]
MGYSQSAVSVQIRQLEQELGRCRCSTASARTYT